MQIVLDVSSGMSDFDLDCPSYALITITPEDARRYLKLIRYFNRADKIVKKVTGGNFIYHADISDYTPIYFDPSTEDEENYDFSRRPGYSFAVLPDKFSLEDYAVAGTSDGVVWRVDVSSVIVRDDSICWKASPKHTDYYIETGTLSVNELQTIASGLKL